MVSSVVGPHKILREGALPWPPKFSSNNTIYNFTMENPTIKLKMPPKIIVKNIQFFTNFKVEPHWDSINPHVYMSAVTSYNIIYATI